jgi:hypothetical protein
MVAYSEKERAGAPLTVSASDDFDSDSSSSSAGRRRTSTEVRQHDHETLTAEEEVEQLLSAKSKSATGILGRLFQRADAPSGGVRNGKSMRQRRGKRSRRSEKQGEEDRLMYNVEEGGPVSSVGSSANSSEEDLAVKPAGQKRKVSES